MTDEKQQDAQASEVERIVMLQALTVDDVKCWDFICTTPAHRALYHNKKLDIIAYISGAERRIQFHFNRWSYGGAFAACFRDSLIVEPAA